MHRPRRQEEGTAARSGRRTRHTARGILPAAAVGLAVAIAAVTALARADVFGPARQWVVRSPDGAITATVAPRRGGYELRVDRDGKRVLQTPLGRAGTHGPKTANDAVDERYETPAGKRRAHELVARRLTLTFPGGRRIQLLVADDGVAFRQTGAGTDPTAWHAPVRARAWLQAYRPDYEGHYDQVGLHDARAGEYGFPALLKTGETWALLTESGLTREAAAHLTVPRGRPGELRVVLPEGETPPRTTPWRVAVIGDLPTVVASDLPLSLGRPSQIRDTSWIRPGRVAWSWWSDAHSPGDVRRQRAFVRSAATYGWEYVLLDEGWDAAAVPGIARYAAGRGSRVLLWTNWKALRDPARRERLFARWASWGVAGVKADFLLSDSSARMAIYDDIARDAARHNLLVAFHGCTVPRGIQRTWPNVLTLEAVEGAERETNGQGNQAMDPRHDVNLAFTRNVVGSMDYTPVTFSARHRDTTDAHRLAQAVVYESGLQHLADTPESYAGHPNAARLLRDLPVAWDDTRLLAGSPDREVVLARRSGDRWWIGSLSAAETHAQTVPLTFLAPGRTYDMHLVRDDGSGGLAVEDRPLTAAGRLSVPLARNGGFAAELIPRG